MENRNRQMDHPRIEFMPASTGKIDVRHTFQSGPTVHFRTIRATDAPEIKRFFNALSPSTRYSRFQGFAKQIPDAILKKYVGDRNAFSVVGLIRKIYGEKIIAEARYTMEPRTGDADMALTVDDRYRNLGIGTCLYRMLLQMGRSVGIPGFTSLMLGSNGSMRHLLKKAGSPFSMELDHGVYRVSIPMNTFDNI